MTGSIIYDRVFGPNNLKTILPRFTKSWEEEFTNLHGLVVPVRSGLIGVQLPVGGMSVYAGTSFQGGPLYPKITDQLWAVTKKEFVKRDKDGKLVDLHLAGTDCVDPGSFAYSADFIAAKAW
jgi:Linalool dehydratase/isomerase